MNPGPELILREAFQSAAAISTALLLITTHISMLY